MARCFETLELGMCICSAVAHEQILFFFPFLFGVHDLEF